MCLSKERPILLQKDVSIQISSVSLRHVDCSTTRSSAKQRYLAPSSAKYIPDCVDEVLTKAKRNQKGRQVEIVSSTGLDTVVLPCRYTRLMIQLMFILIIN